MDPTLTLKYSILTNTYQKLFAEEPKVLAVHAGLECGLIGEKYPGMDRYRMVLILKVHTHLMKEFLLAQQRDLGLDFGDP